MSNFDQRLVDDLAAAVHDAWMAEQRLLGRQVVISRGTGANLMVSCGQLSDEDKQADRATARAVLAGLVELGHLVTAAVDENNPPPVGVSAAVDNQGHLWRRLGDADEWESPAVTTWALPWRVAWRSDGPLKPLVPAIPLVRGAE